MKPTNKKPTDGFYKMTGYEPIDKVIRPWYGTIPFQEDTMALYSSVAYGKLDLGRAGVVRKAIGKKKVELFPAIKKDWMEGGQAQNIPEDILEEWWEKIVANASYQFNWSHALGYACITAQTLWARHNNEIAFYAARMNEKPDELLLWFINCIKNNITVIPPHVNKSSSIFLVEGDSIVLPIRSIDGIGETVERIILDNAPYLDIQSFSSLSRSKINKTHRLKLFLLGALPECTFEDLDIPFKRESEYVYSDKAKVTDYLGYYNIQKKLIGGVLPSEKVNRVCKQHLDKGMEIGYISDIKQGLTKKGNPRTEIELNKNKKTIVYSNSPVDRDGKTFEVGQLFAYSLNNYKYIENSKVIK